MKSKRNLGARTASPQASLRVSEALAQDGVPVGSWSHAGEFHPLRIMMEGHSPGCREAGCEFVRARPSGCRTK